MIVDVHAHFVPWDFLDRIKREKFPSIQRLEQDKQIRLAFAGQAPTRPIAPRLGDVGHRTGWMKAQGIDRQVIGGWLDMFAYVGAGTGGRGVEPAAQRISARQPRRRNSCRSRPCRCRTARWPPRCCARPWTPGSSAP